MELELFKPDPQPEQDAGLNLRYQPAPDTIERCIKLTELSKSLKYGNRRDKHANVDNVNA